MDPIIGRVVAELRAQKKSQLALAQHLGVTQNVITDWKSGRIKSYTKYIHGIADFLDVSVEYLKGETDIKEKHFVPTEEMLWNVAVKVLTPHEERVILAYRAQPALQAAVDKLLDVEEATAPSQTETA